MMLYTSCRFGDEDSSAHHYEIDVQILDTTAGVAVYEETICTGAANTDAAVDGKAISQWTIFAPYTIPDVGARTFELRFRVGTSNGFDAVADVASLFPLGVFG